MAVSSADMSYATVDELRRRIGPAIFDEIYLSDGSDLSDKSDALTDLLAAAAEIDGAISSRYRLPVTGNVALALLKDWCLTLAEERAFARPVGGEFTEKIKRRVDNVRKYLDMIRLGEFKLADAPENTSNGAAKIALIRRNDAVFDRNKMEGF